MSTEAQQSPTFEKHVRGTINLETLTNIRESRIACKKSRKHTDCADIANRLTLYERNNSGWREFSYQLTPQSLSRDCRNFLAAM